VGQRLDVYSRDKRYYFYAEDKWRVANNLTLNLGLRYDHQRQAPASSDDFGPRLGFAWDVFSTGKTVVRGGVGKFYNYVPVVLDLTHQQSRSSRSSDDHGGAIRQPGAQARHDPRFGRQRRCRG
jgi:outer membrane receptor for ferrienterochelin and colicin